MGKWGGPLKERIEAMSIPVTESGCWIWIRSKGPTGYGAIGINKKSFLAHRASWMAFRGPIPDGMLVCHHCDVKMCVNPDHLFLGTHKDNSDDRDRKGRNKPRPGVLNPKAKLSPSQVLAIKSSKLGSVKLAKTIWNEQNNNS